MKIVEIINEQGVITPIPPAQTSRVSPRKQATVNITTQNTKTQPGREIDDNVEGDIASNPGSSPEETSMPNDIKDPEEEQKRGKRK